MTMTLLRKKQAQTKDRVELSQKPFEVFGDGAQSVQGQENPQDKIIVSDFEQEELLSEVLGQQLRRLQGGGAEKYHRLKPQWLFDF